MEKTSMQHDKTLTQLNKPELVDLIVGIDFGDVTEITGLDRENLTGLRKNQLLEIGKVLTKKKYQKSRDDIKNLFLNLVINHNLSLDYITNIEKTILTNDEILSCLSTEEILILKAYLGVLIKNDEQDVDVKIEVFPETVNENAGELVSNKSSAEEPSVVKNEDVVRVDEEVVSEKDKEVDTERDLNKVQAAVDCFSEKANALEKTPKPTDPEWTDYVLSKFIAEELSGKHPRVDGLRRVAELLIGRITNEECELVAPPTVDNGMRACVKASITFNICKPGFVEDKRYISISALADACPDNAFDDVDDGIKFSKFPTSMAETRAKGRCFRQALKLRHVVTAEEIIPKMSDVVQGTEGKITVGSITNIRVLGDRANLSLTKLLESLELNPDISKLTQSEAIIVQKHLATLSVGNVPDSLKRPIDKK